MCVVKVRCVVVGTVHKKGGAGRAAMEDTTQLSAFAGHCVGTAQSVFAIAG